MRAYIDYLRLATWDPTPYTKFTARLYDLEKGWRAGRFLQYQGKKSDHLFHGIGVQNNRRHMIVQASGDMAHELGIVALDYEQFYCTRIDLQATIKEPENYDGHRIYNIVKAIPGNNRTSSLVLSDLGSTVYFGNRTSDTFARLYQKIINEERFLRFEIEVKGNTAAYVWQTILHRMHRPTEIYRDLATRFKLPDDIVSWFLDGDDSKIDLDYVKLSKVKNDRLTWFLGLESTIMLMLNDHNTGPAIKAFLERCLDRVDEHTA